MQQVGKASFSKFISSITSYLVLLMVAKFVTGETCAFCLPVSALHLAPKRPATFCRLHNVLAAWQAIAYLQRCEINTLIEGPRGRSLRAAGGKGEPCSFFKSSLRAEHRLAVRCFKQEKARIEMLYKKFDSSGDNNLGASELKQMLSELADNYE